MVNQVPELEALSDENLSQNRKSSRYPRDHKEMHDCGTNRSVHSACTEVLPSLTRKNTATLTNPSDREREFHRRIQCDKSIRIQSSLLVAKFEEFSTNLNGQVGHTVIWTDGAFITGGGTFWL